MSNTITLDLAALNQHIADALPAHVEKQDAKAQEHSQIANFAGLSLPSPEQVQSEKETLCSAWPTFHSTIEMGLGGLAWVPFMSKPIAVTRAVFSAIETLVYKPLCQTAPK